MTESSVGKVEGTGLRANERRRESEGKTERERDGGEEDGKDEVKECSRG